MSPLRFHHEKRRLGELFITAFSFNEYSFDEGINGLFWWSQRVKQFRFCSACVLIKKKKKGCSQHEHSKTHGSAPWEVRKYDAGHEFDRLALNWVFDHFEGHTISVIKVAQFFDTFQWFTFCITQNRTFAVNESLTTSLTLDYFDLHSFLWERCLEIRTNQEGQKVSPGMDSWRFLRPRGVTSHCLGVLLPNYSNE